MPKSHDFPNIHGDYLREELKQRYGDENKFYNHHFGFQNYSNRQIGISLILEKDVKEELSEKIEEGKSIRDVASNLPVSAPALRNWTDEFEIVEDPETYDDKYKKENFWKKPKIEQDLAKIVQNFIDEKGRIPSKDDLVEEGLPNLERIFGEYKGQSYSEKLSDAMDFQTEEVELMEYELMFGDHFENYLKQRIKREEKTLEELAKELGVNRQKLSSNITNFEGIGESEVRGPEYWKSWENAKNEVKKIVEEKLEKEGQIPRRKELRENNLEDLESNLQKYHDRTYSNVVREVLGVDQDKPLWAIEFEHNEKQTVEDFLVTEYLGKSKNIPELSKELGTNRTSLHKYRKKLGIPSRTKLKNNNIEDSEDLEDLMDDFNFLRELTEAVGGDEKDIADLGSIVLGEYVDFEQLQDVMVDSPIGNAIGESKPSEINPGKLADLSAGILPMAEEELAERKFKSLLREYRRQELGPNFENKNNEVDKFIEELEEMKEEETSQIGLESVEEVRKDMIDYLIEDTKTIRDEFLETEKTA